MTKETGTIASNYLKYLFPWQIKIINDNSKRIILEKSRRVGGTWIMALKAIIECMKTDLNCWMSSLDDQDGKEFIRDVKRWCEVLNLGYPECPGGFFDLSKSTTEMVLLPNGSRITQTTSSADALRAKDGIIILDEIARRQDQDMVYAAAQGSIIQRGKLYLLSTHSGPSGIFYQLTRDESGTWSHHRVTLQDAINEGYAQRFARNDPQFKGLYGKALDDAFLNSIRTAALSEDVYRQEFNCEPLSAKSLITEEEYDKVALWETPDFLDPKVKYLDLYCGIDIGVTNDQTVCWVIERGVNPQATNSYNRYDYRTVCIKVLKATSIPQQYQILKPIIAHKSMRKVLCDIGAQGHTLATSFGAEFKNVKPIGFTSNLKATMAERLKGFIANDMISMPKGNEDIKEQFLTMKRESSSSGLIKYEGRTKTSHCDAFWAAGLSLHAACGEQGVEFVGLY